MRHWTPQGVEDYLERRRVYLREPLAFLILAKMLNGQIGKDEPVPERRGSSADDCIVHWAPGWKEEMEAWELLT
jgi:hypothetical protein